MFTSRSFDRKFGRSSATGGRGYSPLWPWKICFFTILGLSVAVVLTAGLLFAGNAWKVQSVKVEGTVKYDAEVIAEASEIREGDGMMSFDRWGLSEQLKKDYPLIRSIKLSRKLNGEVVLKIKEETKVYYTCHRSNYYLISAENLKVLGISSFGDEYQSYGAVYLGLPEEARLKVGEKIVFDYLPYEPVSKPEELATYEIVTLEPEEEYAYVDSFRETLEKSAFRDRITGMELSDRYDIYAVVDGRVKIKFGSMKELERKINQAVSVLEANANDSELPAILDVSDVTKSTYREADHIELPEWVK